MKFDFMISVKESNLPFLSNFDFSSRYFFASIFFAMVSSNFKIIK